MSKEYDDYLVTHIGNVNRTYEWLKINIPDLFVDKIIPQMDMMLKDHDSSKYTKEEYSAYDNYFYGEKDQNAFDKAWLHHIHNNKHHWQHWILYEDDGEVKCIDMPDVYIVEMICDWWSFSWKQNKLYEIFDWYEKQIHMKLSFKTQQKVEYILKRIKDRLDEKDTK
jgi:hypothetical protein